MVLFVHNSEQLQGLDADHVEHIIFEAEYHDPIFPKSIPNYVTTIEYYGQTELEISAEILPSNLVKLVVLKYSGTLNGDNIPHSLEYFHIEQGSFSMKNMGKTNIRYFRMGDYDKPIVTGDLPNNLRILDLGGNFNKLISSNALPLGLSAIYFSPNFNKLIFQNTFPESVELIHFGHSFNRRIGKNILPSNLKFLKMGRSCDNIYPDIIESAPNLEYIYLNNCTYFRNLGKLNKITPVIVSNEHGIETEQSDYYVPDNSADTKNFANIFYPPLGCHQMGIVPK